MESFEELARNRFSTKNFSNKELPDETLQKILAVGNVAPTAMNSQPQKIYVMKSLEALEKIDKLTVCRYGAPVVLMVVYNEEGIYHYMNSDKYNSGAEDAAIVATHMMLEAADIGVSSCWVNRFDPDEAKDLFNLPSNERVVLLMDLGYPNGVVKPLPPHSTKKDLSEIVTYL